jgi:4-diphosphocytidyl-2-C-methyl-D-erythritol kinase
MVIFPNAKINIGLNITERRADGYHNLETVFYPVKINDVLEIIESDKLSFESTGLPIPGRVEDNLCVKAWHLLKKDHDEPDAAFFIRLMNQTFNLKLSVGQMQDYARKLGADCAFFIENKAVFAFEIGDEFESVKLDLSAYKIVLVMPEVQVSTSEAYRGVKPAEVKISLIELIDMPVANWRKFIKNDFEESIFKNHVEIRGVKAALYEAGALFASMSGSGSSVFGIFNELPDLSHLEEENQVFYDI